MGMKMKKNNIAMLLSLVVASSAYADDSGKIYIATDIGGVIYTNATTYNVASIYNNPLMYNIAFGYHFSRRWAAEIGYAKFNDSTTCGSFNCNTLSISSNQIAAIFSQPLSEQLDLIVKLGQANHSVNESATGILGGSGYSNTASKSSVMYGLGVQYNISSKFSVRAQYTDYGELTSSSSPLKATSITAGAIYNF
jgi:opacity protein-like surface antigen